MKIKTDILVALIFLLSVLCFYLYDRGKTAFENGRLIGRIEQDITYETMAENKRFYKDWLSELKNRGYYR